MTSLIIGIINIAVALFVGHEKPVSHPGNGMQWWVDWGWSVVVTANAVLGVLNIVKGIIEVLA